MSLLVALARPTPSTGFILDSLAKFDLDGSEKRAVKSKAIATEMIALAMPFFALQSVSVVRLALATATLAAMVLVLPLLFRTFARWVAPHAPKSEFAFLLMMALPAAYGTRRLGVCYLVGAFLVGLLARRFRETLPAVEVFASFFAPFQFFSAGVSLRASDSSWMGLGLGLRFLGLAFPAALMSVVAHRRRALGEPLTQGVRVADGASGHRRRSEGGVPGSRLRHRGLVIYTFPNTRIPGLVLGTPTLVFDAPELPASSGSDAQTDSEEPRQSARGRAPSTPR